MYWEFHQSTDKTNEQQISGGQTRLAPTIPASEVEGLTKVDVKEEAHTELSEVKEDIKEEVADERSSSRW